MATTDTAPEQLRKGAEVVARVDLRGVPAGTAGRVTMVTGLSWIRYWVRFDNGVALGTIDRRRLATPEEWKRFLAGDEADDLTTGADDAAPAEDAGGGDSGAGQATPNGTVVPQKLLERSAAARARLGG